MKPDGTVLKKKMRGGVIEIGADGTPTGFLSEQAQTYVRQFIDHENLYSLDRALSNLADIEHHMLTEGYMVYHEGRERQPRRPVRHYGNCTHGRLLS